MDGPDEAIRLVRFEPDRHLRFVAEWFAGDPEGAHRLDGSYARPGGWSKVLLENPERVGFLATHGGEPVGFVDLELCTQDRKSYVASYVTRGSRKRGFCVRMLEMVSTSDALQGIDSLQASSEQDNTASIRCLERAKFVRVGQDEDGLLRYVRALNAKP